MQAMQQLPPRRFSLTCALLHSMAVIAAEAWWSPGHLTVGEIAAQTLASDPNSGFDVDGPAILDLTLNILETYALFYPVETVGLSQSSVWMDRIKGSVKAFSHWHYVDLAVEDEKTIPMSDVSPLDAIRIHNATWVLSNSEYTLTSSKSAAWDQSFFLMVLTHVLGDIHQPLHCSTRYTSKYPSGDRGGNSVKIEFTIAAGKKLSDSSTISNLHALWDYGVGVLDDIPEIFPVPPGTTGVDPEGVVTAAKRLMQLYPLDTLSSDPSFFNFSSGKVEDMINDWAAESNALAAEYVYKTADGEVLVKDDSTATIDLAYVAKAQPIVEEQLAKAGYRLAYMLEYIYSINTDPATLTYPSSSGKSDKNNGAQIGVLWALVCVMGLITAFLVFRLKRSVKKNDQLHRLRSTANDEKVVSEHFNS